MELLQQMVDVVFGGYMLYLAPFLLLMMGTLFSERLIDLIMSSVGERNRRRTSY